MAAAAERCRREGDAEAAIALAETGLVQAPQSACCRIALALALLDTGDRARAGLELERVLAFAEPSTRPVPPEAPLTFGRGVGDDEIEDAFAEAESNPDEMMDANRVVEQTLRGEAFDLETPFDVSAHPTYATRTMASLLEKQGRPDQATALRTTLDVASDPAVPAGTNPRVEPVSENAQRPAAKDAVSASRDRSVATLEGWLRNVQRSAQAATHRGGTT
jgi:hypothetical protein